MERLIFRILWYVSKSCPNGLVVQWPMSPLQLNSLSHGTKSPCWRMWDEVGQEKQHDYIKANFLSFRVPLHC